MSDTFRIPRGLIVSCQGPAGTPLDDPGLMAAIAACAELAGAVAIRAQGVADLRHSRQLSGPDLRLVEELVGRTDTPVTAEGRYWTPGEAAEALRRGAHAVVIGTAITNPLEIARRFATALGEALTR